MFCFSSDFKQCCKNWESDKITRMNDNSSNEQAQRTQAFAKKSTFLIEKFD